MTTCEGFPRSPSLVADFSGDLLRQIDLNIMTSRQGLSDIFRKNLADLDSVFKLQKSHRYSEIMQKVEENALIESCDEQLILDWKHYDRRDEQLILDWRIFYEKNQQWILDCYALSVEIENEIVSIHNFIRDKYKVKVGELESLVDDPIEYGRFVRRIGKEWDLTTLVDDLKGVLPQTIITVFCFWQIGKTIEACDRVVALLSTKKKLEDFVERRNGIIAPNLCAFVGSGVAAAKIMSTAGGLDSLARMSGSCFPSIGTIARGYFEQYSPSIPNIRQLGNRAVHIGHLDSCGYYPCGKFGADTRRSICDSIDTWKEYHTEQQKSELTKDQG